MEQIKRAALAPSQPSAQDYSVAATATRLEQVARYERARDAQEGSAGQRTGRIDQYI